MGDGAGGGYIDFTGAKLSTSLKPVNRVDRLCECLYGFRGNQGRSVPSHNVSLLQLYLKNAK